MAIRTLRDRGESDRETGSAAVLPCIQVDAGSLTRSALPRKKYRPAGWVYLPPYNTLL